MIRNSIKKLFQKCDEEPVYYDTSLERYGKKIEYRNLSIPPKGGPVIGELYIDNRKVSYKGIKFGGPALFFRKYMYLPVYMRGFLFTGFRICRIDFKTGNVRLISGYERNIIIDRIENDKLFYRNSTCNNQKKTINL